MRIVVWKYLRPGTPILLRAGIGDDRSSNCSMRGEGGASAKPAAGRQGAIILKRKMGCERSTPT